MHVADRYRRLAITLLLASSLAACGSGGGDHAQASQRPAAETPAVAVRTATAQGRQQAVTLTLDGTLVADEESQLTSVVAGRVVEVLVERGAVVEEGQPIVRLRDVDYRLQAQSARAQVEQARARLGMDQNAPVPRAEDMPDVRAAQSALELAQANLQRAEELAQRGVLAQQALDETRTRAAQAREQYQTTLNNARASISSLSSARTTLAQAATSASEATVRAPFAGEIASRNVSVGEYVTPQSPIVSLVRTDPLRIEVQVPQQHLMAVRPGQTVRIAVDAVPDRTFEGTVRYVSAAVQRETRGLTVEAIVPNPERLLRPGLFATARIETGSQQDVAVVPASAVMTEAGVDRVFVVVDGAIEERVVSIAERSSEEIVIAEGLRPGEEVATDALDQLGDGVRVAPAGAATAAAPSAPTPQP
ncbi:Efflux RND transporter periplasmic adaptor subunit [Sandaracinus amylolyticus]|nr:Efflux RND transporter periplasmic adaptor subunit [Sandaracinus amylolyticus]